MSLMQSILLGIIQGLTEFLPISSSAHLVLVPYLLGWDIPAQQAFVFDVLVQVATLIGVVAFFWGDLVTIARAFLRGLAQRQPFSDPDARWGWYLILASLPAGLVGLAIKDQVELAFASPQAAAGFLILTAGLLLVAERFGKRQRDSQELDWKDALWMGMGQALAIFPGVSRSGATISGGMLRHLERPTAARFSFLMSVPIMLAAGLVALNDLLEIPQFASLLPVYLPGFISAGLTGYLTIRWLLGYLTRHRLYVFSFYCIVLAALAFTLPLS